MSKITVGVDLLASPAAVWADVRHVATHVEWMTDAVSITFVSSQKEGVGTVFDCATKVGPIKLTDKMRITSWIDEREMGVRHEGIVTGEGKFTLEPLNDGKATRFTWQEDLKFPLWLGAAVGGLVGAQVMKSIWRKNLHTLQSRFEK